MTIEKIMDERGNNTFVWKYPLEDFETGSQLIVHESQRAVFFMNGQALDIFGPGRHTIETQNLPLITRALNRIFGDRSPFHCEIYFINVTEQMAMKWGTDSRVEYVEPQYNFPISIGASGEMSLRVEEPRRLLTKIVGTTSLLDQASLIQKFRGILMSRVKAYLATYIREHAISIFAIDEHITAMSEALHLLLKPDFADYGLDLERFYITNVAKPEEDRMYQRFREIHFRQYADVAEAQLRQQVGIIDQQTQAQRMVLEAQGIAQKRALEGYTYQDEHRFQVADKLASNDSIAQMGNVGIGIGMITGISGIMSNAMGAALDGIVSTKDRAEIISDVSEALKPLRCVKCDTELPVGSRFCFACGAKIEVFENDEIMCKACGEKTMKGRYCAKCGAALVRICSNCGKELTDDAKFCQECGKQL